VKGLALFLASIWGDATTDQQRCQAEADFMAKYRFFAHVGPTIGRYEGVGWGRCDKPCTCKPDAKGLKVTGDAFAKTKDGVTIRVTSWR
jgi:hypothetical protein